MQRYGTSRKSEFHYIVNPEGSKVQYTSEIYSLFQKMSRNLSIQEKNISKDGEKNEILR